MGRNLHRSDLTELQESTTELRLRVQNDGIVKMFCGRNLEVWNTCTYLFDNLMHLEY